MLQITLHTCWEHYGRIEPDVEMLGYEVCAIKRLKDTCKLTALSAALT